MYVGTRRGAHFFNPGASQHVFETGENPSKT
jgi:hypothetical protein